jgi:hypothetical protein
VDGQWTIAIAPLAGLALTVLTQIMVVHVTRGRVGASILIGVLGGLTATLAFIALGRAETPSATGGFVDTWLLGVATYLALAFGFWAFLNLNITSMRIRILRVLLRAGGRMALSDMAVFYTPAERLRRRLERLEKASQIMREDGRWVLRFRHVLVVARCVEALRSVLFPGRHHDRQRP